jgi:hypothetical protein
VVWDAHNGKWKASIREDGCSRHLGYYDDDEEAARAYDKKMATLHADAVLNFLPDGSLNPDRKQRIYKYKCVDG